jgi:D-cysteine desulfhydrase
MLAEELKEDIARLPDHAHKPVTIVIATGSGGTAAGLILGSRLHGLNARVVSINVCDDRDYFMRVIGDICAAAIAAYQLDLDFDRQRDIAIIDGYVGRGYSLSRPEELSLIREVARTEGLFLDPVYTGKAFFGMVKELERYPRRFGERVVFIHTGGIFGLLAKAEELAALF